MRVVGGGSSAAAKAVLFMSAGLAAWLPLPTTMVASAGAVVCPPMACALLSEVLSVVLAICCEAIVGRAVSALALASAELPPPQAVSSAGNRAASVTSGWRGM